MYDQVNDNFDAKCERCATRLCYEERGVETTYVLQMTNPGCSIISHTRGKIEDCAILKYLKGDQLPKPLDTQQ
jgi:hypothetical protein